MMHLNLMHGNIGVFRFVFYFLKFRFCLSHRDNVEWDQDQLNEAEEKIKSNSSILVSAEKAG